MDSSFELCELERLAGDFFKFLGGVDLVIFRKFTFPAPTIASFLLWWLTPECLGSAMITHSIVMIAIGNVSNRIDDLSVPIPDKLWNWCWRPRDSLDPLKPEVIRWVETISDRASIRTSPASPRDPIGQWTSRHSFRNPDDRFSGYRQSLMRLFPASIGPSDLQYHY